MKIKRCLIKISGASFGSTGKLYNWKFLKSLVQQVNKLVEQNIEIILVVGGGNICRGEELRKTFPNVKDIDSSFDYAGMLGTVINGLILKNLFRESNKIVDLLSDLNIDEKIIHKYTYEKAKKSLKTNKLLILTGGIGLPNFSTDVATFFKAKELNVDTILLGKYQVDGIYSDDPKKNAAAIHIPEIKFSEIIARRLKIIDLAAACIGMENNFAVFVFDITKDNAITKVSKKEGNYTHVKN